LYFLKVLSISHQVFFETASHLSFSKAAQVLYMSQPAISKHIKQLETYYKTPLFERRGSTIRLTEVGNILFHHLKKAKHVQKELEYEISTIRDQSEARGTLNLGSSTIVTLYMLPEILSGFRQQYPDIAVQVVNRNSENVFRALEDGQIDLGIVEVEKKLTSVAYQHFTSDEVIAVCSSKSPWAKKKKLSLKELCQVPMVLRERGSGTLSALTRELNNAGIRISDLNAKVRLGGTEALKNYLLVDASVGFLSKYSVAKELAQGELVELKVESLNIWREFFFIRRHGTADFGLIKQFIRYALQCI